MDVPGNDWNGWKYVFTFATNVCYFNVDSDSYMMNDCNGSIGEEGWVQHRYSDVNCTVDDGGWLTQNSCTDHSDHCNSRICSKTNIQCQYYPTSNSSEANATVAVTGAPSVASSNTADPNKSTISNSYGSVCLKYALLLQISLTIAVVCVGVV